jgi:hypothetical protein
MSSLRTDEGLVKVESNLEEYPLFAVETRNRKDKLILEHRREGECGTELVQRWKVELPVKLGMPGLLIRTFTLRCCSFWRGGGMPRNGELVSLLRELLSRGSPQVGSKDRLLLHAGAWVVAEHGGDRDLRIGEAVPQAKTAGHMETQAWCKEHNRLGASVDWHFRTEDAHASSCAVSTLQRKCDRELGTGVNRISVDAPSLGRWHHT